MTLLFAVAVLVVGLARIRHDNSIAERQAAAERELSALGMDKSGADDAQPAQHESVDGKGSDREPSSAQSAHPAETDGKRSGAEPADSIVGVGSLVFVNRTPGADYGKLASLESISDTERTIYDQQCERAHASAGVALCLEEIDAGLLPYYSAKMLDLSDDSLAPIDDWRVPLPSRARVDPAGRWVGWTGFVTGHSYLDEGEFATETLYVGRGPMAGGPFGLAWYDSTNLPERFRSIDANWWGLTFDPSEQDQGFATFSSNNRTEIVRLDLRTFEMHTTGIEGACPSIAPDGSKMVVRRETGSASTLTELHLVDIESGETSPISAPHFIDDQVEWLDSSTIIYAVVRDGEQADPAFDLWSLDISTPGAEPELVVPFASSPALYRDARS